MHLTLPSPGSVPHGPNALATVSSISSRVFVNTIHFEGEVEKTSDASWPLAVSLVQDIKICRSPLIADSAI